MKLRKILFTLALAALTTAATSVSAALLVDFTTAGNSNSVNNGGFTFTTTDPSGTGVTFDITASAVIPAGGGQNGGDVIRINAGIGSEVENAGDFLNVINNVPEVLRFTVSNVTGLAAGESLVIENLLSQNGESASADQSGGHGGTFGNVAVDSLFFTSDSGTTFTLNQSDAGDLGAMLLAADDDNNGNPGNTFEHSAGNLGFTNFFDVRLTNLNSNNAVVIQGFEFAVVPEPSAAIFIGLGSLLAFLGRRKRNILS